MIYGTMMPSLFFFCVQSTPFQAKPTGQHLANYDLNTKLKHMDNINWMNFPSNMKSLDSGPQVD
jgi:hypothetical protein